MDRATQDRVALSFDDGPDPEVTPAVLDALAKHGARATFFAIGRLLEAHPELARRIAAEGHELGNHSWRHSRWQNFFGAAAQAREIAARGARDRGGDRAGRRVRCTARRSGSRARRSHGPPTRPASPWWAGRCEVATRAAPIPSASRRRVLERIRPGDIVLLHDGHDRPGRHRPACARAVPLILQGLREKGLRVRHRVRAAAAASLRARRDDPDDAAARTVRELRETNRRFYDALWTDARLIEPERFNTWPLVHCLVAQSQRRLEVAPGLRPRLPIDGTHFVDLSAPAVARLRERGASAVRGLVTSIPFADGAFDLVCALDIVEHVDDEARAVGAVARRRARRSASALGSAPRIALDRVRRSRRPPPPLRAGAIARAARGAWLLRRAERRLRHAAAIVAPARSRNVVPHASPREGDVVVQPGVHAAGPALPEEARAHSRHGRREQVDEILLVCRRAQSQEVGRSHTRK